MRRWFAEGLDRWFGQLPCNCQDHTREARRNAKYWKLRRVAPGTARALQRPVQFSFSLVSCIGVVTWLVAFGAPATARADTLALDAALAIAEARSPEVRAAQARIDQGRGRRTVAGYALPSNPTIDLGFKSDVLFANRSEKAIDVGLEQELEIFGQRGLRIDVADTELAARQLELAASRLAVRAAATVAYFDLMFRERRAAAFADVVEQATRLAEAARRRLAAGDIGEAEYQLVAADLVSVRAEARRAESERIAAQARLNTLVGRPSASATVTAGDFPPIVAAAPLDRLLAWAHDRRPEIRAAKKDVEARSSEVALRQRERLPNPTVALGYSYDRTEMEGESQFLGVRLSLPLPLVRRGGGEIQEARGQRAEAEARRDGLLASLDADVATARARQDEARQRVVDYAELEGKLAATLQLYEKAYTSGKIDLAEWMAVRDRVLRTTFAALEARHDAAVAGAQLELAVGGTYTEVTR